MPHTPAKELLQKLSFSGTGGIVPAAERPRSSSAKANMPIMVGMKLTPP